MQREWVVVCQSCINNCYLYCICLAAQIYLIFLCSSLRPPSDRASGRGPETFLALNMAHLGSGGFPAPLIGALPTGHHDVELKKLHETQKASLRTVRAQIEANYAQVEKSCADKMAKLVVRRENQSYHCWVAKETSSTFGCSTFRMVTISNKRH
jgi:hypothetical protein